MDDEISDIRAFVAMLQAGSLSGAAKALGSSPPAMSRRLARLEARLGVRLVARTSRRFAPTEEGLVFQERCLLILAELDAAEAEAAAAGRFAHGTLVVAAPMQFGRMVIAPLAARFAELHPAVGLQLILSDGGPDLAEEGLDLVLRTSAPPEGSAISRRLLTGRRIVCASPDYLARHGTPSTPDQLSDHECLRLMRGRRLFDQWMFRDQGGTRMVTVAGRLATSSGEVLHGWALAGRGLALKALWDIEADIRAGRLVECLADYWCDVMELHAVYLSRRHLAPRIRLFLDFIASELPARFKAAVPPG